MHATGSLIKAVHLPSFSSGIQYYDAMPVNLLGVTAHGRVSGCRVASSLLRCDLSCKEWSLIHPPVNDDPLLLFAWRPTVKRSCC